MALNKVNGYLLTERVRNNMSEPNLTTEQKTALTDVQEKVAQAINKDFIEDITRDNKMEFIHDNIKYRIAKPNYNQKHEIYRERVKKFTELLKDPAYSLEKDLKKSYLVREIDVDEMTNKIKGLEEKKGNIQFKLGELLKNDGPEADGESLKKEIEQLTRDQQAIAVEKQTLLEYSIENQVVIYMYNYMTYLITEKFVGEKWVKAFATFQEFMNSDETLVGKLAFLITMTYQNGI